MPIAGGGGVSLWAVVVELEALVAVAPLQAGWVACLEAEHPTLAERWLDKTLLLLHHRHRRYRLLWQL